MPGSPPLFNRSQLLQLPLLIFQLQSKLDFPLVIRLLTFETQVLFLLLSRDKAILYLLLGDLQDSS